MPLSNALLLHGSFLDKGRSKHVEATRYRRHRLLAAHAFF
jgi:hypothetical protein